jgi:hypothetical protein
MARFAYLASERGRRGHGSVFEPVQTYSEVSSLETPQVKAVWKT